MNKFYISEQMEKAIYIHLYRVFTLKVSPLILGIFGPTGEGKTYQCEKILDEMGIENISVHSKLFESRHAGNPLKEIDNIYLKAVSEYMINGKRSVIVIHDIDTLIGNWGGEYQYTVNQQHIIKYFMELGEKKNLGKIPIIFTGNNLTTLYKPLKRYGRMKYFVWKPVVEEKIKIISGFLRYGEASIRKIVTEVNKYCIKNKINEPPVAFYTELKSSLLDDIIWENRLDLKKVDCNSIYNKQINDVLKKAFILLEEGKEINNNF